MANPKIEVEIGASVKGLEAGVAKAENTLKGIGSAAQTTSPKVQQLVRATSNYNGVGIEFSRIIQDAPFGILGVGNNITRLAETFQNLRAQSTSTGAALKTALASIISPANLVVLGISAVTTAFTLYSMGAFKSKESTKELKTETDLYKESLDKLIKSLNSVNSARLQSSIDSGKEISSIDLLKSSIEDESKSRESRLAAFNTLKKLYPSILGNLDAEKVLINGLGKEYAILTAAIFERASASAIESEAGKITTERVKLLQKENSENTFKNKLISEQNLLQAKKAEALAKINSVETKQVDRSSALREFSDAEAGLKKISIELETLGVISSKTKSELLKNKSSTDSLKTAYSALNQELISSISKNEEGSTTVNTLTGSYEKLLRVLTDISSLPTIGLPKTGDVEVLRERFTKLKEGGVTKATPAEQLSSAISAAPGIQTDPTPQMVSSAEKGREILGNIFADVNRQAQEFNEMIRQTLTNGISNAITDLAFSIGEALAIGDNVFSAIGKSLINSIGDFLGQLGAQLIQVGVAGLAFASLLETIKSGSPAAIPAAIAAIGIGAAMVVAAGAFRGIAGKGLSGGGGGSVGSGVSSQSFGGSGVGFDNSSIDLNGEFIVRGTDLVYVISQEGKKRSKG